MASVITEKNGTDGCLIPSAPARIWRLGKVNPALNRLDFTSRELGFVVLC